MCLRLITLLILAHSLAVLADESLTTYVSGSQSELIISKPIEQYLNRAYSRLGYRINFVATSNARSVKMAEEGEIDALTLRTDLVAKQMSNMIKVPVPLISGDFILYCQANIACNYEVLKTPENIIGAVNGVNLTSLYMINQRASVYKVNSGDQLFEMFNKKRLDYILTFELEGINAFSFEEPTDMQKLTLLKAQGFHLIHKKHEDIVNDLAESLKMTIEEQGPVSSAVSKYLQEKQTIAQ